INEFKPLPIKFLFVFFGFLGILSVHGQTKMDITAVLNDSTKIFNIEQKIEYENNSSSALSEIYLNDWANSFKDKTTPLARRFAEDYVRRFHFAREEEWGYTKIYSITNENVENFTWERPEGAPDIIKVVLKNPLFPGEKVS